MRAALLVTGAVGCFRRPEFAIDAVTYDVIPPMAARSLLEAVHWTPAIRWTIERIEVLRAIRTEWSAGCGAAGTRQLALIDPAYAIHARFDLTSAATRSDSIAQHSAIFRRRAKGGRYHDSPYLGRRGLHAVLQPLHDGDRLPSWYAGSGVVDLGWMLLDRELGTGQRATFFKAVMVDGKIDLTNLDPAALAR